MRITIATISSARPPALVSAAVPAAEAARRAVSTAVVGVRPSTCTRPSAWRPATGHAAAGLPVFVGTGVGAADKTGRVGVVAAVKADAYASEQHVRIEGSTTSTNLQDQYKLRLMSRRDLRTWRPPS